MPTLKTTALGINKLFHEIELSLKYDNMIGTLPIMLSARQEPVPMDIWEPCNYASNLAYDRLVLEMCLQQDWTFSPHTVGIQSCEMSQIWQIYLCKNIENLE